MNPQSPTPAASGLTGHAKVLQDMMDDDYPTFEGSGQTYSMERAALTAAIKALTAQPVNTDQIEREEVAGFADAMNAGFREAHGLAAPPALGVGGFDPWIGDFAVAEIGPVWALTWIGRHSIDKVASMHGLRTGDRLVPECDFLSLRGDYNRLLATCDHLQSLIDSPKDGDLIVGGMAYDD